MADDRVDLSGCKALVTGAAHRLGRATALALAESGADILVHCYSSRAAASKLTNEIVALGRRAEVVVADLTSAPETKERFEAAIDAFGGLDILINNVGTIVWKDLASHDADDWQTCLDGTLFATLHASQAALPALRRSGRGRILNILDADADSTNPAPFATAYKIGKRAAFTLTKTMAVTEAEHGVTVNAVSPGTLEDSPTKPALEAIPAGRYGTYKDVAGAVLHLASESASYVTGAHLKVSGGYLV